MKTPGRYLLGWILAWLAIGRPLAAETFELPPLDAVVSDGVPAVGAGNIETVGSKDEYTFTVTDPVTIYVDEIVTEGTSSSMSWRLLDPSANVIAEESLNGYDRPRIELTQAGQYRFVVEAPGWDPGQTGIYGFRVLRVSPDQYFGISLDELISENSPSVGMGSLESAGTVDGYYFSGAMDQVVVFDDQSTFGCCRVYGRLYDPLGNQIADKYLDGSPTALTLPMDGEYYFEVRSEDTFDPFVGGYSFAFRNAPVPEEFDLGDVRSLREISENQPVAGMGRIESPKGEDIYRFQANAGELAYFEDRGYSSHGVFFDNPVWSLIGPSGVVLFEEQLDNWGFGVRVFPETGEYRIRVRFSNLGIGTYSFRVGPVPAVDRFTIAIGDAIEPDSPAGSGRIEQAWAVDVHEFSGLAGQVIQLDERGMTEGCCVQYSLLAPNGAMLVANDALDYSDPERVTLPVNGTYQLVVHTSDHGSGSTGAYRLALLAPADVVFPLSLNVPVGLDSPAVGAGRIESVNAYDVFTFAGTAGQVIFVDRLTSADGELEWFLEDPDGARMFQAWFNNQDPGRFVLPKTGGYRLVVRSYPSSSSNIGNYSFVVRTVADDAPFDLAVGVTVSDGVPGVGAGVIASPGQIDTYRLPLEQGQTIYLADLGSSTSGAMLQVFTPSGWLWYEDFINQRGLLRFDAFEAGVWRLEVKAWHNSPDWTGQYSIGALQVVDHGPIALTLPATVSEGVPAAGAGAIETRGSRDTYQFTGTAGQVIYVDDRQTGGSTPLYLQLFTPSGQFQLTDFLNGSDYGRYELPETGTYRVVVQAGDNSSEYLGAYSFALLPVADDPTFALTLPAEVSDGVPGAGAGNLEVQGARDTYTFSVEAGTGLYFEDLGSTQSSAVWTLVQPDGGVIFSDRLDGSSPGRRTLLQGGEYVVRVQSSVSPAAITGPYRFAIRTVTDNGPFAIGLGTTVIPAADGRGAIESAGSMDTYTLVVPSAQYLYFDDFAGQPGFPQVGLWWELRYPGGRLIASDALDGFDRTVYLGDPGTYTLTVVGGNQVTSFGNYSFKVWGALPEISSQTGDLSVPSGGTAELAVVAASPFQSLSYQWFQDTTPVTGGDVQGAQGATLRISPASALRSGTFRCVVSNPFGATTSAPIVLTVTSADFFVAGVSPGPQAATLSQLDFTFSTAVDPASIGIEDFQVVGPGGALSPASLKLTALGAARYRLSFSAVSAPGTYQVTVGPAILGEGGQPMKAGAFTPYYAADFEGGADGNWSRTETTVTTATTTVLGRFGNESAVLTLANLPPHESVRVVWDGVIIDSWDGNSGGGIGPDYHGVVLDGGDTAAWEYTFSNFDRNNQSYSLTQPEVWGTHFIWNGYPDAIYRDLTLNAAHNAGTLTIGFRGRGLQDVGDESWAIDNVRVLLPSAADGTFRTSVTLDPAGPSVTEFTPNGTVNVPVSTVEVTFNETLGAASIAAEDFELVRPDGSVVGAFAASRVQPARVQVSFPSQRMNGAYSLRVGPGITDGAGNLMDADADGTAGEAAEDRFTGTFTILTPPQIASDPQSQTVLRNSTVKFTVGVLATPPVSYQWQKDGENLEGRTGPELTLPSVQLTDQATYRCLVTDAGGTTPSQGAFLTVQENFGTVIPLASATRTTIPPVPGNGVAIELFNGIGGGPAPSPADLAGRTPSGTTLSPFIDFPRPGSQIAVGASFNTFFQDTTTPPEQVLGLAAANFILRHRFYLSITSDIDLYPVTPEIDVQLGVGSDDGFRLEVGGQVLGTAGDRGFSYSWMNVTFAGPGLYPVELLFAANAVGASGLEFAWATAQSTGGGIVPQNRMYVSPDLGDRLITFEEVPTGTVLSNQYAGEGVIFETHAGNPVTTSANPSTFVPVSPTRVFGDPAAPSEVEFRFVHPTSGTPGTTPFVAFFLIDAAAPGSVTKAYDATGREIYTRTSQAGAGSRELVSIGIPGIARVRVTLGGGTETAAIDNLVFVTPTSLPDLVTSGVSGPAAAAAGATVEVTYTVTNQGSVPAAGPWTETVLLSGDNVPGGDQALATFDVAGPLAAGASVVVTRSVTIPAGEFGNRWFVVTTDSGETVQELGSSANNTAVSTGLVNISQPDLVVEDVTVPPTVVPGVPFNITWTTRNAGTVVAAGPWSETVSLSADGTIGGDLLQVTLVVPGPLAAGASLPQSTSVLIPADGIAGNYRAVVATDAASQVIEESDSNNASISAGALVVPTQLRLVVAPGQTTETGAPVNFTVTRNGSRSDALTVSLSSGDSTELTVPASTVIPAGAASVSFAGTPVADGIVDGDIPVQVTAAVDGFAAGTASVTVRNVDLPVLTLTVASAQVGEGLTVAATVSRGAAAPSPVTVSVASSDPVQLIAPGSVVIPANQASVTFALIGAADTAIEPDTAYRVDVNAPGHVPGSAMVTVLDDDLPTVAIALNSSSVSEGAGATATQGTVTRSFPSDRAMTVRLTSSDASAATVPATVTIPAGQASVSFQVGAVDDDVVDGPQNVQVSAVILVSGVATGSTASIPLTVTDDDGATLLLSFNRTTLAEGVVNGATGTLRRNTDPSVPLVVDLGADIVGELVLPATVTFPAGSATATFPVGTLDDGTADGARRVTVTASRSGFTPGVAQLVVSDINLPDLLVASVTLPASGETDSYVTASYRVENRGLRSAPAFTVRLFLSEDATYSESDVLASQYSFPAELPAGSFFEVNPPIRLPREVGRRHLIAVVDANGVVTETDESNNTTVSAPIQVQPAYSAVVSTDTDVAPAGTVIPMRGVARLLNGSPAPSVLVNVHVVVRGTRRVISALTDSAGAFRLNFTPLPGEAGQYEIAAAHPGVTEPPMQDLFVLLGFRVTAPAGISVIEGGSATGSVPVDNLSSIDLNAVAVEVLNPPAGITVTANLSGSVLPGDGRLTLGYAVTVPLGVVRGGTARLRVTTQEGPSAVVDLPIQVDALRPRLVATPSGIISGMRRGTQVSVAFEVANQGGLATGPLRLLLPPIPWLSSASADLPSLAPGEKTTISLLLTPPADLPLGPYTGSMLVGSDNLQVTIPFTFRCLSDSIGAMQVEVTDEYTFYAEGAPRLTNAAIRLVDAFTGVAVLETNSGPTGLVLLPGIAENYYRLEISADQHSSYSQVHLVPAGGQTNVTAFLSRQAVRYTWKVEPTEIEDRTKIVIETVFETAVPLPVVTIEPASYDLAQIVGNEGQVNFKVTNHGLIAAKNASLQVPEHPDWVFEPLIRDFGDLPAKTSLVVPMTIRRATPAGGGSALRRVAATAAGGGSCVTAGFTIYELVCGEQTNKYTVPYVMFNAGPGCGGNGGGTVPRLDFRGEVGPGGGSCFLCSVPTFGIPVTPTSAPEGCDPCKLNLGISLAECIVDQLANKFPVVKVLNCLYGLSKCGGKIEDKGLGGALSLDCLNVIPGCSPIEIPGLSEFSCIRGLLCACVNNNSAGIAQCLCQLTDTPFTRDTIDKCGGGSGGGSSPRRSAGLAIGPDHDQVYLRLNPLPLLPPNVPELAEIRVRADRLRRMMAPMVYLLDDEAWAEAKATDPANIAFWAAFAERSGGASADQHLLNPGEYGELVALAPPAGVPADSVVKFLNRWNRTVEYRRGGITNWTDLPAGFNEDFIADDVLRGLLAEAAAAREENLAEGFNDEYSAIKDARDRLNNALLNGGGVCARVKLRLEQEAVITRDAFKATLEVENNTAGALDLVSVELRVEREDGSPSTTDFGIRTPTLSGLNAVDGSGVIGASSTGKATWILVPTSDAAPTTLTVHYVSGTLRYRQDGVIITVPLAPSRIEVLPNPNLVVQYFHQRDVFSDDPFTVPTEPSVPFTLGVLVRNEGYGTARNFRIISGQPQIVENEKGLLVDFKIIATEVAGQNLTPSLTANFGNVGPGQIVIGRWLFTSTLQGNFREYTASFAHQDELGDPRLSLIEAVTIHEMTRMVEVGAPFADGKPDFLVNDEGDPRNMPDTLYLSDGTTNRVSTVELATVSATPGGGVTEITINAATPAGWAYLRIPEPSNGALRLHRVVRSDGKELGLDREFWITDRTFPGLGARPIYEQILHLIDYNSTGSYRLIYTAPPAPDGTAPVSAVLPLPASSPAQIPVSWSGTDDTGVASYDIYVSEDGGPFNAWLTATPLSGSVYPGVVGRSYAFFSRARDLAGNVEAQPAGADANTTVAFASSAPTISGIAPQTIPAGLPLAGIGFTVGDSDTPLQDLTINVGSSNPGLISSAAVVITGDGSARTLSLTSAAGQAGQATITLTVSDGSASASTSFLVTVTARNQSPIAGADLLSRKPGEAVKVAIADLLANDTDPDFDPVGFAGVTSPSANGGTVRRTGPWIVYSPAAGSDADDSFTYQVSDGRGGVGIGVVTIRVSGGNNAPSRNVLTLDRDPAGRVTIRFAGIPGRQYRIEATGDLANPSWSSLGNATAGVNGLFEFTDTDAASHVTRYYRSVDATNP